MFSATQKNSLDLPCVQPRISAPGNPESLERRAQPLEFTWRSKGWASEVEFGLK